MPAERPIILILGPTAAGKTPLALALAARLPGGGECIVADSMQVYRGMDIGTAKPTTDQRAAVPHHLIDLVEPSEDGFTVDHWLALADQAIGDVRGRGRGRGRGGFPIIVGGTNLYVQAFLGGMFDGPEPDPDLRKTLEGTESSALRAMLERVDPPAAARIHANDRKRTIRAIEVHELTGKRISDLQQQWQPSRQDSGREDVLIIGLEYPVAAINRRINARVKAMIDSGLVEEVRGLMARGGLGRQASEALGYKQIIAALDGRCTMDEAIEQIKIRTRRYAKQQRSWLRRFRTRKQSLWLNAGELSLEELVNQSLAAIGRWIAGEPIGITMPGNADAAKTTIS